MKRQTGFYWVKFKPEYYHIDHELLPPGCWFISFYDSKAELWHLNGAKFGKNLFSEINETRILSPDEVAANHDYYQKQNNDEGTK